MIGFIIVVFLILGIIGAIAEASFTGVIRFLLKVIKVVSIIALTFVVIYLVIHFFGVATSKVGNLFH